MNDERLAELKEKYKDRNLFEELAWGAYANHSGYTSKQNGEFLNWLCAAAYKALKARPQGEWIEHYSKELSDRGFYLCSRCKAGFQRYERGVRHSDLPWIDGQKYELHCIDNFCPNCGADMRGGKE